MHVASSKSIVSLAVACTLAGCSLSKMAADTTAGFLADAAPAGRAFFDYETAGIAAANGLAQLEGLHSISPDNEQLTLTLAQAYVVYAFGWVMDEYERALFAHDYDVADRHQQRAFLMYSRSTDLVLRLFRERDEGIDEVLHGDPDKLKAYLREHYSDPEEDMELLFWLAISWGSTITNSPEFDALVDMPAVKVVGEHGVALDETYENGGLLALLGGFDASYPEQLGGNWARGKAYFERAIEISKGRSHLHHINFARTYAVNAQDKELFLSLLRRVVEAPDLGNDVRLSNKVARRRAERYLANVDEWFY